jgi:hypothetical protein
MSIRLITSLLLVTTILTACEPAPAPFGDDDVNAAQARVLLLDVTAFRAAFEAVSTERHVVYRTDVVESSSSDSGLTSRAELTFDGTTYEVSNVAKTGSLPRCRSCDILSHSSAPDPGAISSIIVDVDAPFLNERGASAFRYAEAGDTLINGVMLASVLATAREDEPRAGRYRRARLYFDPSDQILVGMDTEIERSTFFLHEGGRRSAFVDRHREVPFPTSVSVVQDLRVLFGSRRIIHTELRYAPLSD